MKSDDIFQTEPITSHFPESGLTSWQVSRKFTISKPCKITADRQGLGEIGNMLFFRVDRNTTF